MSKLDEAKEILKELGLPPRQQNDRSARILLALANIKETDSWKDCQTFPMCVVGNKKNAKYPGIMRFTNEYYGTTYAENSRETFRRQTLHQFIQAGIVLHNPENPDLPTNSKDNHYCLSDEAAEVIRTFGTDKWEIKVKAFKSKIGTLLEMYSCKRNKKLIPLTLPNGRVLEFSPGAHNVVQAAIINEFRSYFAPNSELLYVGDTANKDLYVEKEKLEALGIPITEHSKLPDVVLYDSRKRWLYLVEAVTSHGPVSMKRIIEINDLLSNCRVGKIYVSAFPDFKTFKKFGTEIAWDTEVWLMETPEHMIHFNGDRFIGPR